MINGTPQIVCFSIDLHKHLIEMPSPVRVIRRWMMSFFADLTSEHGTKPVPPISDGFMANIDSTFMQKIFDIAE